MVPMNSHSSQSPKLPNSAPDGFFADYGNRADIAREEGLSRARVTQLFGLLELDAETRNGILLGVVNMSIREALRSGEAARESPAPAQRPRAAPC